jgi:hypothetical protein
LNKNKSKKILFSKISQPFLYLVAAAGRPVVEELADKPVADMAGQALARTVGSLDKAVAEVAAGSQVVAGSLAVVEDIHSLVVVEDSRAAGAGKLVEEPVGEQLEDSRSQALLLAAQLPRRRLQTLRELFAYPLRIDGRLPPAQDGQLLVLKMVTFVKKG